MKSGTVEFWIEVPLQINYSPYKAERQTRTYPGCSAGIMVNYIKKPGEIKFNEIISKHTDEIKKACEEDLKE